MAQGTNASALIRLRPIENNNIGAIVEEHVRYWKKTRDAEEAEELARQARAQEFNRKAQKEENAFIMKNLGLDESNSYFRDQIVSDYENQKPIIVELSKKALRGDTDAILRLDSIKQNFKELVTLDKTSGEALKKFIDSSGKRNPLLDVQKENFVNNVSHGNYVIRNGKIAMLDESGKSISTFSIQEMRNKLNSLGEYSGKFDPTATGKAIADTIELKDINGNRKVDNSIRVDGIRKVLNAFDQDQVSAKSWAVSKGIKLEDFGNLDSVKLNNLATQFYDEEVFLNLQQRDNTLGNQSRREDIAKKSRDRRKSQREEDLQFARATDETGNDIAPDLSKDDADLFNSTLENGGRAFTINNGQYRVGGISSNITQEIVGGSVDDSNQLTLLVKRTVEVPIVEKPKLVPNKFFDVQTDNGIESLTLKERKGDQLIFFAENDKDSGKTVTVSIDNLQDVDTGKKRKEIETRLVTDDAEINAISSDLGLGNTSTLFTEANKALGEKPKENSDKGILD